MAEKSDFSVEEWDLLRQSPLMASMLVVAADPSGPVGLLKESAATAKMMLQAGGSARTPLLKSLVDDMRQNMSLPTRPPAGTGVAAVKENSLNKLKQTSELLAKKATPEEAQELKQWLADVARATAEAAKEGGFLGFGGTLVSDAEKAAMSDINVALGLQPN